jgi:hypothetical protein
MVFRSDASRPGSEAYPRWAFAHSIETLAVGVPITYSRACRRPARRSAIGKGNTKGIRMCLLCEELWMPFEPPPPAKARRFVADAPEPDAGAAPDQPSATPPVADTPGDAGRR